MKITVKRIPWIVILGVLQAIPANAGVEVIDTGRTLGEYPNLHWMDNKRVIFTAASGSYCEKEGGYKQPLNQIVIFDTETRKAQEYGEAGVNGLCYAEGNVSYARRVRNGNSCPTDRYEHYMGKLGHEVLTEGAGKINTYTCRPESELPPLPDWMEAAKKEGRLFKRLRPEHGWVELGKAQNASSLPSEFPIRLYQPSANESEGIVIRSVEGKDLQSNWVYYRFKDAYRLEPRGSGTMAWWFYPDGRIEVSPRMGIPVRKGFIFNVVQPSKSWIGAQTNPSGLYFRRTETESIKLVAGFTNSPFGFAISPDGCRVAFGTDKDLSQSLGSRFKLQIIDVCLANSGT